MPDYYLDSSALVKRYLEEDGTDQVLEIVDAEHRVCVSRLTMVEVASAVMRRHKAGHASEALATELIEALDDDFRSQFEVVELGNAVMTRGVDLARMYALRACDAIQLSCALIAAGGVARSSELVLVCSDKELNAAAEAENLIVLDPSAP